MKEKENPNGIGKDFWDVFHVLIKEELASKKNIVFENVFNPLNAQPLLEYAQQESYITKIVHLADHIHINHLLNQSRFIDLELAQKERYVNKKAIAVQAQNRLLVLEEVKTKNLAHQYELYNFTYLPDGKRNLNLLTKHINEWQFYYHQVQKDLSENQQKFIAGLEPKIEAYYQIPTAQLRHKFEYDEIKVAAILSPSEEDDWIMNQPRLKRRR